MHSAFLLYLAAYASVLATAPVEQARECGMHDDNDLGMHML